MPSYFYHLKFELYPYSSNPNSEKTKAEKEHKKDVTRVGSKNTKGGQEDLPRRKESKREVWVPEEGSDIWSNDSWPHHPRPEPEVQSRISRTGTKQESVLQTQAGGTDTIKEVGGGGAVIDCGPARGAEEGSGIGSGSGWGGHTQDFPTPRPGNIVRDLETARRDWRFGEVRVESVDLDPTTSPINTNPHKQTHTHSQKDEIMDPTNEAENLQRGRGESSSAGSNGLNSALTGTTAGGRVTKARFDALEGKNTEIGWGVVHLYRDGEETIGLGAAPQEEIYAADDKATGNSGDEDCTVLCIPAVPSYLTPSDFLGFVGEKTRESVSHFRMVMTGRMNRYLVLMKFRDGGMAKRWRGEWDGKVFNSMEPETCHVTFIKSITFQTPASSRPSTSFPELSHDPFTPTPQSSTFLKPFPPPTPNLVELPTCPVCLERMDDTTGLLTILCQHVFHCDCLQKWKGSGCPVCRHTNPSLALSTLSSSPSSYPHDPANPPFGSGEASLCSTCDSTDDLWICLICGNVGCGRYKGGHAKEHWKESAHNFALEIETQHVWDYAGDMWVHRLIRDKGDSKVIELPSSSRGNGGRGGGRGGDERREGREEEDMVPREKLERIGIEYTHLLTSQLESQRVYFEDLVSKAVAKASSASLAATTATSRANEALSQLSTLNLAHTKLTTETIPQLEKELGREKRKAEKSSEIARGFGKSLREEKEVGEGLMERIEFLSRKVEEGEVKVGKLGVEIGELREENRDLLFSVSAGERIRELDAGGEGGLEVGEIEGGSLVLPVQAEKDGGRKRKGKGKGKS